MEIIHDLSESKLSSDTIIYNALDTKASWIILFLWTIIVVIFNGDKINIGYVISAIFFCLSIAFSIVVIRPRDLWLGVNLYKLTEKYWNKNADKKVVLEEIIANINGSIKNNEQKIKIKSQRLRISLIMLCIWLWTTFLYVIGEYVYSLLVVQCLNILH